MSLSAFVLPRPRYTVSVVNIAVDEIKQKRKQLLLILCFSLSLKSQATWLPFIAISAAPTKERDNTAFGHGKINSIMHGLSSLGCLDCSQCTMSVTIVFN